LYLDELFLVNCLLFFANVLVHEEVVDCLLGQVNLVDLVEVRLLVVDHVPKVVLRVKNELSRVHKNLDLVNYPHLQSD